MAYSEKLKCGWSSLRPLGDQIVRLDVPSGDAPDMQGTIAAVRAIMPDVIRIHVYMGDTSSVVYANHALDGWRSFEVH